MSTKEIKTSLNDMANQLVSVAGTLMMVATSGGKLPRQPNEHDDRCDCQICRAFLTVQSCQNKMEEIIRGLS